MDNYGELVNFGDLQFSLLPRTLDDGRNYYQLALNDHVSHTEYLPNVDIDTQPYNLFIFSGDNNDSDNSALTTDENCTVIAKRLHCQTNSYTINNKQRAQRILRIVLLVGWDTGDSDPLHTMHFRGQKLEFGKDGGSRYATIHDIDDMLNGDNYDYPFAAVSLSHHLVL